MHFVLKNCYYFVQVPPSKTGGLFSDSTESDDDDGGLFSSKPITSSAPKTTVSHVVLGFMCMRTYST